MRANGFFSLKNASDRDFKMSARMAIVFLITALMSATWLSSYLTGDTGWGIGAFVAVLMAVFASKRIDVNGAANGAVVRRSVHYGDTPPVVSGERRVRTPCT